MLKTAALPCGLHSQFQQIRSGFLTYFEPLKRYTTCRDVALCAITTAAASSPTGLQKSPANGRLLAVKSRWKVFRVIALGSCLADILKLQECGQNIINNVVVLRRSKTCHQASSASLSIWHSARQVKTKLLRVITRTGQDLQNPSLRRPKLPPSLCRATR